METGGRAGCVFNAAKEVALDGFIGGRIGFMDMAGIVETTLDAMSGECDMTKPPADLEEVLAVDETARERAWTAIGRRETD
jgi:1-deoxy-D-xylulose-5-phosphate reductoisomerase